MALVVRSLYNYYNWLFHDYQVRFYPDMFAWQFIQISFACDQSIDTRLVGYTLTGSPIPIIALVFVYVYYVTKWGPKWMESRPAYDLQGFIKIYNLIQIFTNLFIGVYGGYYSYWVGTINLKCGIHDPANNSYEMQQVVLVTHMYYMSKIIDLLDTVFFVLRKRNNQISFLHVYHHGGMVLASYVYTKFLAGSHGTLLGIINSFVHVIMYGYYFLTSYRPELKHSLWWKKHITQIQLIQFGILVIHFMNPVLFFECAQWPKAISFIGVIQNLFMFSLFLDFYIKAYIRQPKKQ